MSRAEFRARMDESLSCVLKIVSEYRHCGYRHGDDRLEAEVEAAQRALIRAKDLLLDGQPEP